MRLLIATFFIFLTLSLVGQALICGDTYCETDLLETIDSCPFDCDNNNRCGNKICNSDENKDNCPMDCGNISNTSRAIGYLYHSKQNVYDQMMLEAEKTNGSWEVIGQSIQGRDILLFKFGNPNGGKFMFDGEGHGPEDCGTEMGMQFIYWVMDSNDTEAIRIRNNNYLLFIPVINIDTNKRQNLRRNYTLSNGTVLYVPYGVDLNRNFPTGFGGSGSSALNDSYQFRGLSAGSEPETQAVVNAMSKYQPQVYMNTHCGMNWLSSSTYGKAENTSKIKALIHEYENTKNFFGKTTTAKYGNGTFGTGGYVGTEGAKWGGSGWIFENAYWEEKPLLVSDYNNKFWNISSVVYRAMANAVEVIQPAQIEENISVETNITTLNDTAQNVNYYNKGDFRNVFGISWRGNPCDNLAYAKTMGYDYVVYQSGMNKCSNAKNMRFYIGGANYFSVPGYASYIDYNNLTKYTQARIDELNYLMIWKGNYSGEPFPQNLATGWFNNVTTFRPIPDFQRQEIIDISVINATSQIAKYENLNNNFTFGGWAWDVPDLRGEFWTSRQKGYTDFPCASCDGKNVALTYWSPNGSESGYFHDNLTYDYANYSEAMATFQKKLYSETRKIRPDMKVYIEPYGIYNSWISSVQNRPDVGELMPYNETFLTQEDGDKMPNNIYFVNDSRIFSKGLITKEYMGSDTPDNHEQKNNTIIAGFAAESGAWFTFFGRWGGTDNTPNYQNVTEVPAKLKLIRAVPGWENLNNVPLAKRHWNYSALEYNSPNSSFSINSIYSTHPKTQEIYFVILNHSRPMMIDKKPKEIYKTNNLMEKTVLATSEFSYVDGGLSLLSGASEEAFIMTIDNSPIPQVDLPNDMGTDIIVDKKGDLDIGVLGASSLMDLSNETKEDISSSNIVILGAVTFVFILLAIFAVVAIFTGAIEIGTLIGIVGIIMVGAVVMMTLFYYFQTLL